MMQNKYNESLKKHEEEDAINEKEQRLSEVVEPVTKKFTNIRL